MNKTPIERADQVKRIALLVLGLLGMSYYFIELFTMDKPTPSSQIAVRVGFVLILFWLAFPQVQMLVRRISPITFVTSAVVMLIFVQRGPLILIPCLIVCALLGIMQYAVKVFTER